MNTTLKVIAAAAALVATAGAQASILFVDNFDAPTTALTITDATTTGGAVWQAAPGTTLSAPNIATSRRIGAELTSNPFGNGSFSTTVGGSPIGTLSAQGTTGTKGKALVEWIIPAVSLPTLVGNSYFFSILASTTGISGATNVNFIFDGANDFTLSSSFPFELQLVGHAGDLRPRHNPGGLPPRRRYADAGVPPDRSCIVHHRPVRDPGAGTLVAGPGRSGPVGRWLRRQPPQDQISPVARVAAKAATHHSERLACARRFPLERRNAVAAAWPSKNAQRRGSAHPASNGGRACRNTGLRSRSPCLGAALRRARR